MTIESLKLKSARLNENYYALETINTISSRDNQRLSQLLDRFATLNTVETMITFAHSTPRSPITYRLIDRIC